MRQSLGILAMLAALALANCASAPSDGTVPARLLSCGAIGNKSLQLFEVCGQIEPEMASKFEISTSECGVIRLTRAERAFLCSGAKTLYGNLPTLDRAHSTVPEDASGAVMTYDDQPSEEATPLKR